MEFSKIKFPSSSWIFIKFSKNHDFSKLVLDFHEIFENQDFPSSGFHDIFKDFSKLVLDFHEIFKNQDFSKLILDFHVFPARVGFSLHFQKSSFSKLILDFHEIFKNQDFSKVVLDFHEIFKNQDFPRS